MSGDPDADRLSAYVAADEAQVERIRESLRPWTSPIRPRLVRRFFQVLVRLKVPAPIYYWLLDRLTDNNGWRPLSYREARRG